MEMEFRNISAPVLDGANKGSLTGIIPVSIAVNSVLLWNIVYSTASWSCNAAQGWKWQLVYAATWWWTAALPRWWVRLTGPGLVHQLTCKVGDLACLSTTPNTNFLILLAFFSPPWIMSLIPLESLIPFVLSLLFHQSTKESQNN